MMHECLLSIKKDLGENLFLFFFSPNPGRKCLDGATRTRFVGNVLHEFHGAKDHENDDTDPY